MSEATDIISEKLDKMIALLSAPPDRLWTVDAVAGYLGVKRGAVYKYAITPGFPKAIRMPSDKGQGHRVWEPAEIRAWAKRQKRSA